MVLRVGVLGGLVPDSLTANVYESLDRLGVQPVPLGPVGLTTNSWRINFWTNRVRNLSARTQALMQRSLPRRVQEADCDLIITADKELLPETVASIGRTTPIVLWYPDAVSNLSRFAFSIAPYARVYVTDPLLAFRMSALYSQPTTYLPEACDPRIHRPIGQPGSEMHIAMVGNLPPYRVALLRRLVKDGVPIRISGAPAPWWLSAPDLAPMHTNEVVTGERKSRTFTQARAVLNNLHPAEMTSVNCRLFEAAGAGAVVLCEDRPTLADLFTPGVEVLTFDTYDSLLEQCRMVLSENLGPSMGMRASQRSHTEHTYEIRIRRILEDVL